MAVVFVVTMSIVQFASDICWVIRHRHRSSREDRVHGALAPTLIGRHGVDRFPDHGAHGDTLASSRARHLAISGLVQKEWDSPTESALSC